MAVIRDVMPAFELYQPSSMDEALRLMDRYGSDGSGKRQGRKVPGCQTGGRAALGMVPGSTEAHSLMRQ